MRLTGLLLATLMLGACAPTPDPDWLVFSSSRSGNGDLDGREPGTGELRLLVGGDEALGVARPDAARSRWVHTRFSDAAPAMLVAEGRELFVDPNGDASPVWSPSGETIAYVAIREGQADLYVARPDESAERRLTEDPAIERYPAWSPTGDRLVMARRDRRGWSLRLLDADASASRDLTEPRSYLGHPAWSPDGRQVAVDTAFEEEVDIARVDLRSGRLERLTDRPGRDLHPAWSLDGRELAWAGEPEGSGNWDVWTLDLESGCIGRVTRDPAFDGGPVYVEARARPR